MRLICCAATAAALLAAHAPAAKADAIGVDPNFVAEVDGDGARIIALQPDGKILIAGFFMNVGGVARPGIARLHTDGSPDTSFNLDASITFTSHSFVGAIVAQPDGKILLGVGSSNVFGAPSRRLARLHPDGSIDTSFNADVISVSALALQPDGRVIVAGSVRVGEENHVSTARLHTDGTLDTSFQSVPRLGAISLALQPDGKVIVGTVPLREPMARLHTDGTVDDSFFRAANGVRNLTLQPDGKVIIQGEFFEVQGMTRIEFARLNSDGSLDVSFDPDVSGVVAVAVQPDGKVILAGGATATRRSVTRVNPDGSVDESFGYNTDGFVRKVALQPDGKILIGGPFTSVDGVARKGLARLLPTPTVSVVTSANPSAVGQPVTFSVEVVRPPGSPHTPTGTIEIREGVGTHVLSPLDSAGRASVTTPHLRAGTHDLTVVYSGDSNFTPSSSPIILQRVEALALRFDASAYSVNEGAGGISVLVLRSDATSGSVAVSCATSDATASSRSDYTPVSRRLRFAPGETVQSFVVYFSDDSLVEGDETLTLTLSDPAGGFSLVEPSTVTVTIRDNDTAASAPNPVDSAQFFVHQHYLDFFSRFPDDEGFAFWFIHLNKCGALPSAEREACREVRRINVSAAFFLSIEFQGTGFFALRARRVGFGQRSAEASRMTFEQFLAETRQLGEGVIVGSGDWQERLAANRRAYLIRLVGEPDFLSRFPASLTADEYIDALYSAAGVTPGDGERGAAVAAYRAGGMEGRAAGLGAVADSESVTRAEFNPAFVLTQYFGYLRRNPTEAPDADDSGYRFWLEKLDEFGGDFVRAEMVKGFLNSAEYRQRFGRP